MKLPTIIHIGHRKIKIKEISPKTASKDEIYGDYDSTKDLIRIDKSLKDGKKLNTLLHEIVHVLLDIFILKLKDEEKVCEVHAELKLKDEEKVCEVLGVGLSDLFHNNPKLIELISSVYNTNKK
jgi:Zn-dependent peptidase ImmA (M78 family)